MSKIRQAFSFQIYFLPVLFHDCVINYHDAFFAPSSLVVALQRHEPLSVDGCHIPRIFSQESVQRDSFLHDIHGADGRDCLAICRCCQSCDVPGK